MNTAQNLDTYTIEEVSRAIGRSREAVHNHVVHGRLEKQTNTDKRYSQYGYRLDKEEVHQLYGVSNYSELLLLNPQNYHKAKAEGLL